MNFLGDIVEHDVPPPEPLLFPEPSSSLGFPKLTKQKPSQWRSRLQEKGISSMSNATKLRQTKDNKKFVKNADGLNTFTDSKDRKMNYEGMSEAERIHQENIEILSRMSLEERESEKQELIDSLDPAILQMLLNRSMGRKPNAPLLEDETGEWYGSSKANDWGNPMDEDAVNKALGITNQLPLELEQLEDELVEEEEQSTNVSAATAEQIDNFEKDNGTEQITGVHFPHKSTTTEIPADYKLDINDPDFNEKLHDKYFPDLPRDTESLKWMEPVPDTKAPDVVESVGELRFDFHGDLITPDIANDVPTYLGLHHHAEQPQLPGYTLLELSHYARSKFHAQRCIAIQTLGRVLHKLGKNKYHFQNVDEDGEVIDTVSDEENLELKLWKLCNELHIIDTLEEFSDETRERNLSVRNYSIELLWLWRQGGGDKKLQRDKTAPI